MKQIFQNLRTGATEILEMPCPVPGSQHLLIASDRSLISLGTERMLIEFGKAGWIEKARQQPDKVRRVIEKVMADGVLPALDAVLNKMDEPLPLGYCNVGRVIKTGSEVSGFSAGDRVVSNGAHAEIISVPVNLSARIPENVGDDEAVFTVLGAIALQGIRLLQPTLGETVAVMGTGLIGLLTIQLLRANGCRVLGVDLDEEKLRLARQFGAETINLSAGEDVLMTAQKFSRGRGIDAVIIAASTESNEPVHQAASMCRKRGRIVLVGTAGLEISRADFYEKELTFQVSCSYGPGRYDANYEEKGQDYPIGFVRWPEQRNFEAVLDMMADRRLDVKPLISHCFGFEEAEKAYALIGQPVLGIVLKYTGLKEPSTHFLQSTIHMTSHAKKTSQSMNGKNLSVAFVGAGNHARGVLIPAFKKTGADLKTIASLRGFNGVHAGRKFGFDEATTDTENLIKDGRINTVVIATKHDIHSPLLIQALKEGKHVFVEKPLAINRMQLEQVEKAYSATHPKPLLMVGFNRRFSPHVQKMKFLLETLKEPKTIIMTVNAGPVEPHHWVKDREVGGGRLIGEGCHFIDILRYIVDYPVVSVQVMSLGKSGDEDKVSFTLRFEDGSMGTIHYLANGNRSFPKERLEVFCAGRILQLNNFRKLRAYGWPGFRKMNLWRQDKGHYACVQAFVNAAIHDFPSPIPFEQMVEVTRISFDVSEAIRS
jgi:predicted dehydrogenase